MSELIEKSYSEAVAEIKEEWFSSPDYRWYEYITNLPIHLQVVYMVMVLESQVFNGGFHQYFANRYGQFARKTVEYLRLIGSDEKASILMKAYTIVNYEKLNDQDFRNVLLEGRIEKLFITDELFDALDGLDAKYDNSNEDITELLTKYLEGVG
jgi:ribonucleotide reductase beta subunit family protein with ferritin-like domain